MSPYQVGHAGHGKWCRQDIREQKVFHPGAMLILYTTYISAKYDGFAGHVLSFWHPSTSKEIPHAGSRCHRTGVFRENKGGISASLGTEAKHKVGCDSATWGQILDRNMGSLGAEAFYHQKNHLFWGPCHAKNMLCCAMSAWPKHPAFALLLYSRLDTMTSWNSGTLWYTHYKI